MTIWTKNFKNYLKPRTVEEEKMPLLEKSQIQWRPVSYKSAIAKYKFRIYSRRAGAIAKYTIALDMPKFGFWQELADLPGGCTFEEAKTDTMNGVRICKFGIPESDGTLWMPKKK